MIKLVLTTMLFMFLTVRPVSAETIEINTSDWTVRQMNTIEGGACLLLQYGKITYDRLIVEDNKITVENPSRSIKDDLSQGRMREEVDGIIRNQNKAIKKALSESGLQIGMYAQPEALQLSERDLKKGSAVIKGKTDDPFCTVYSCVEYIHPKGGGQWTVTEDGKHLVLPRDGVLKNLSVTLNKVPGIKKTHSFTVRLNGLDTRLNCTVTLDQKTCTNMRKSISVKAGDEITLQMANSSFIEEGMHASWEFEYTFQGGRG